MTLLDDHGALSSHAEVLLRRLDRLSELFGPREVIHDQHRQFAERCAVLCDHLGGVLDLSAHFRYAAALAITRTSLEHHLVDRLLFLADRWVVEIPTKADSVAAEESRLAVPRSDIYAKRH